MRHSPLPSALADEISAAPPAADRAAVLADLHAENRRFRAAVENISHGLSLFDRDFRLLVSNRRYAEIYGLDPDRIRPGMTMREILDLRSAVGAAGRPAPAPSRGPCSG